MVSQPPFPPQPPAFSSVLSKEEATKDTSQAPSYLTLLDEEEGEETDVESVEAAQERIILVTAEQAKERLDRLLSSLEEFQQSRSQLKRWIQEGYVLHNGQPARPSQRLRAGDVLSIRAPKPAPSEAIPEEIPLAIAYEDEHLIVINKPAGMVVHPAPGHPTGTLVNALLFHCRDLAGIGDTLRPGIVHRLDQDTTGLLVVAKHDAAHRGLAVLFHDRPKEHLDRRYLALASGRFDEDTLCLDTPYGRHPTQRLRFSSRVESERRAITHLWVRERFALATLLEVRLHTGRTHQIRVHLADRGRPLIGDPLYGGTPPKNWPHALRHFPRQALHAYRLAFTHPITQAKIELEAPLPSDMQELLDSLMR